MKICTFLTDEPTSHLDINDNVHLLRRFYLLQLILFTIKIKFLVIS